MKPLAKIPPVAETPATPAPHNAYHRQCVSSAREATLWAVLAGLELMPHKLGLPHGNWIPWVAGNCEYSRRTASSYLGAAERAMQTMGMTLPVPSELRKDHFDELKARVAELLEHDHLDEQRVALIAALRPASPNPLPAKKSRPRPRPTGPRPLFSVKAVPKVVERWQVTPPALQHAFLDAIRDDALAYLAP